MIRVGDIVECINAEGSSTINKGSRYRVKCVMGNNNIQVEGRGNVHYSLSRFIKVDYESRSVSPETPQDTKRYEFSVPYESAVNWELVNTTVEQPVLVVSGLSDITVGVHLSIFDKAKALGEDDERTQQLYRLLSTTAGTWTNSERTTFFYHAKDNMQVKLIRDAVKAVRQAKGTRRKITVKYMEV